MACGRFERAVTLHPGSGDGVWAWISHSGTPPYMIEAAAAEFWDMMRDATRARGQSDARATFAVLGTG